MLLTVLVDENAKPDQIPAEMSQRMLAGQRRRVAEQVQAKVLDAGIDGVIINMPLLHTRCGHRGRRGAAPAGRSLTGQRGGSRPTPRMWADHRVQRR